MQWFREITETNIEKMLPNPKQSIRAEALRPLAVTNQTGFSDKSKALPINIILP